jgi:hypothetical protein
MARGAALNNLLVRVRSQRCYPSTHPPPQERYEKEIAAYNKKK